ncbi:MAG: hypothetical protein A3B34_03925 [Candidatus Sungbacteria bacterium RIFCSPLOWO2_01_FULL_54_21]|uniref:Major facilitator superfamily (MFS) profile domain-containing protein n=2 Tax=Candidatus Sungiibacteriota TaxID=1817917 RepID=A0A1G2L880_9BACT|nr:MAG: hypothetical protein A2679_01975 [Candidatus Sungbacteria bacterium RIFCSPHIGHO2_01_FULL_54_26]OHA04064.1 MAG: hypothetical protein A3C92_03800 [Candidatus Sungbacteria bacterium RIFCSPHIGHO2_02_FULL_53_17]OHA06969.1 MAG: hypothetical protein A3B34_03925 [Candidatus Sungbacteria bacterium RIFCSPLOWO2_01_FULL_54_21]
MTLTPVLAFDIAGIIIGVISVLLMLTLKRTLGGRVGAALNLVVGGVLFNILALGWTIVFTRLRLLAPPTVDVHHLFMVSGMVLFVLAARKFSLLARS